MKKRICSIFLALAMLLSLLPTVVFAAGDTHAAKIELVKTSEKTYNGVDVMRLDLYIKAEKIVGSPLAMVKYDTSKLTLINKNAGVISSDDIIAVCFQPRQERPSFLISELRGVFSKAHFPRLDDPHAVATNRA